MLKLRLTRLGDTKRPSYRVVAMEALSKRDGKAVAYLGNYFPLEDNRVVLKEEEIINFLKNGAQPTRTVKSILVKAGVWAKFEEAKRK
ncbi:30S ribosomal protein S16 [Fusobacterium sp. DD29]|uniref:30S ribosomal protein S16 n=1 Tax=unclassified Fusobacterium TaxID=2648384 RepID=UPI001B8B35C1|nr:MULTISPECIES: 30S ribosomal protein S16 [unclassified Fusobacterium]MBR8701836.1 30S ribosomal protein S16 [Fusobacterium sp. DD45]MBR8711617.1 30S ribosomal protein S16 [Fusobacterium sp. DD28]MBR8750056.1 30S ribosomal protein S16 [Fusobacterium sp. DD29]MBR8752166.1 30S ribosomal protein S16 [Fusobacterium sp. DD26]MBR8762298.1 30S ribosomal protein S16 [Fusobacterium sp. DD25]